MLNELTMVMMEKQQEKVHVCGNNWVRRIVGVDRLDKRWMEGGLREEVGVKEFQEKAGEELIKVGWTRGMNGGGTVDKESSCPPSGG